jgi:hypothetical protein
MRTGKHAEEEERNVPRQPGGIRRCPSDVTLNARPDLGRVTSMSASVGVTLPRWAGLPPSTSADRVKWPSGAGDRS